MITKKASRGRPKKKKERTNNPYLEEAENNLLNSVKPKNKGTIMSLLNKKKISKYELDEVFVGDENEEV